MSSQPEDSPPGAERLADFLENLVAPLVGIVPYRERDAFRREAHAHLDGLIQEYLLAGQSLPDATENALREFGEPWQVGAAFLREWQQGDTRANTARTTRAATVTAFAWFGIASTVVLLALERHLLDSPGHGLLPLVGLLACLTPFAAGGLVGATAPARAEEGTRNAVILLILHSLATGLLLLPRYDGLAFAVWQLVFWLPCGRVCAGLTAAYVRHRRRQQFWRFAR